MGAAVAGWAAHAPVTGGVAVKIRAGVDLCHACVTGDALGFRGPGNPAAGDAGGDIGQGPVAISAVAVRRGVRQAAAALGCGAGVTVIAADAGYAGVEAVNCLGQVETGGPWTGLPQRRAAVT